MPCRKTAICREMIATEKRYAEMLDKMVTKITALQRSDLSKLNTWLPEVRFQNRLRTRLLSRLECSVDSARSDSPDAFSDVMVQQASAEDLYQPLVFDSRRLFEKSRKSLLDLTYSAGATDKDSNLVTAMKAVEQLLDCLHTKKKSQSSVDSEDNHPSAANSNWNAKLSKWTRQKLALRTKADKTKTQADKTKTETETDKMIVNVIKKIRKTCLKNMEGSTKAAKVASDDYTIDAAITTILGISTAAAALYVLGACPCSA